MWVSFRKHQVTRYRKHYQNGHILHYFWLHQRMKLGWGVKGYIIVARALGDMPVYALTNLWKVRLVMHILLCIVSFAKLKATWWSFWNTTLKYHLVQFVLKLLFRSWHFCRVCSIALLYHSTAITVNCLWLCYLQLSSCKPEDATMQVLNKPCGSRWPEPSNFWYWPPTYLHVVRKLFIMQCVGIAYTAYLNFRCHLDSVIVMKLFKKQQQLH